MFVISAGSQQNMCRTAVYSRGLRQEVHRLAKSRSWDRHHKILVGDHAVNGSYADYLTTSVFCLVLPGMPHAPRSAVGLLAARLAGCC